MNNSNCCIPYICTSSSCTQACERHNIGTQCGTTATNIAAQTTRDLGIKVSAKGNWQNQQNYQKSLRQLKVFSSAAEEFQDDLDGMGLACSPYKHHAAGWA